MPSSLQQSLVPVTDIADRVGRVAEEFGENLDRWNKRRLSENGRYEAALGLVSDYEATADRHFKRLKRDRDHNEKQDRAQALRERVRKPDDGQAQSLKTNNSYQNPAQDALSGRTLLEDLRHWRSEAQTWRLCRMMIEHHHRDPTMDSDQARDVTLAEVGATHQYSPEEAVWHRFLVEDNLAKERHIVMKWLEQAAEENGDAIHTMVEHLERGKGLWSSGWLDTRTRIKSDKVVRAWRGPIGDKLPEIRGTNTELLVTQLDPDAPSRQERTLEQQDTFHELGIWMTCFEMLRRGRAWGEIREWCNDRAEGWRSLCMGAMDSARSTDTLARAAVAGPLWRRMCFAAARNGGMNDYESAVFGLLSGDLTSMEKVCCSWDDLLYAHYNSLLLAQYDAYLRQNHPERLPEPLADRFGLFAAVQFHGDPDTTALRLMQTLREHGSTSDEARKPLKLLQGALVSNSMAEFIRGQGLALSSAAMAEGHSVLFPPLSGQDVEQAKLCDLVVQQDKDILRMAAHMYLIFADLGLDVGEGTERVVMENVLVAYIQHIRENGKMDMIPLYASRLSKERSELTLARVFVEVNRSDERGRLTNLLCQYNVSIVGMCNSMYGFAVDRWMLIRDKITTEPDILETTSDPAWPGQRIRQNFMDRAMIPEEELMISAMEWFMEIQGFWGQTFETLSDAYRLLLGKQCMLFCHICRRTNFTVSRMRKAWSGCENPRETTFREDLQVEDAGYLGPLHKRVRRPRR